MRWIILSVVILSIVLGIVFWRYGLNIFNRSQTQSNQEIQLTLWNIGEDEKIYRAALDNYRLVHPNIRINYVNQSLTNYRTRLQTQLRASQGPDIFLIHQSWLLMFRGDLAVAPELIYPIKEYEQSYYPIVKSTLMADQKIYAIPRELDGLVLFSNEDILKAAQVTIPKTWQEFLEAAKKMTVKNDLGQIQTSGAALGVTNVDWWPEIISLLFLQQPAGDLVNPGNKDGAEVLQFFTNFIVDPRLKTWDVNLPTSTTMFSAGKLAFYFAPSSMAQSIKEQSPNLNFKISPVPQLSSNSVNLATFWAFGVSGRSSHSQEAWQLLKYLSSEEAFSQINQSRMEMQLPATPTANIKFSESQKNDPWVNAVLTQAPYYKSWYLNSGTQDAGINEEMINIYQGAITAALGGQNVQTVLSNMTPAIKEVLGKYP